jgi:hypothetical protein
LQSPPHRLNFLPVRPDFNLPAFGVAGAAGAHRAVAPVAAKTFGAHTILAGVTTSATVHASFTGKALMADSISATVLTQLN